ncbi:cytospin-B isoform X1 [Arapaima gigas]
MACALWRKKKRYSSASRSASLVSNRRKDMRDLLRLHPVQKNSDSRFEERGQERVMLKGGATKGCLPKLGLQERVRLPATTPSTGMKTSRSSNTLASDLRLSRLKRASSDDALAKPGMTSASIASRMKKTVTTGAICELAGARPRNLTGIQSAKKSGIPAPKEIPTTISRDRVSLRDQLRTTASKKLISSSSASSFSTLAKNPRATIKTKSDNEASDKAVLECQVKELLAEAKAKEFEISKLRMELQRCRGQSTPEPNSPEGAEVKVHSPEVQALVRALQEKNGRFQRELAALRDENQNLKEKLLSLEQSPLTSSNGSTFSSPQTSFSSPRNHLSNQVTQENPTGPMNGSPVKDSPSSSSDITKGSPSPASSEFEKIPSRTDSICSGTANGPDDPNLHGTDLSVECLTEKIQKMEESHHSTAEELQATLQELSDQQQMVQELTAENERLTEEKGLLQTSLQQQRERVELLIQKNESLLAQLQAQTESQEALTRVTRVAELEQRYSELVENSRFEREKLVDIQQQLTGSLRELEKEHQEAQGLLRSLKEERDALQNHVKKEQEANNTMAKTVEEQRSNLEALMVENGRLKAQLDMERQKVAELKVMQSTSDSTEVQQLLKTALSEKEWLEMSCAELREELLQTKSEADHIQGMLFKVEAECQQLQEQSMKQEQEQGAMVCCMEERRKEKEAQIKDLKETIFELEDQVEQHRAVQLHTNQTILDLESQVKKLEEQKFEAEKQLKALNKQMKDETEEWRRFQADLQTAVVVANDIKVEAQQELRTLHRRLQEEQERNARLAVELEQLQGTRSKSDDAEFSAADGSPRWCGISANQTAPNSSDSRATVKSLIKSFDLALQSSPGHAVTMHSSPRSLLSGIPVRSAPAAAVSPIQRHSAIKPMCKVLEKTINLGGFTHSDKLANSGDDLNPSGFMRKSPSLESVIKTPRTVPTRNPSFCYRKANSKLSVERKDPLAALARQYGGSKRNALLKWCQRKTEGYPNIDVTNFSSSWSDGLAFCALLHTYLPAHIPYQELGSHDKSRNLSLAFRAAESVGIKATLDINDMMRTERPDWQSIMHYVSQIYKYFET